MSGGPAGIRSSRYVPDTSRKHISIGALKELNIKSGEWARKAAVYSNVSRDSLSTVCDIKMFQRAQRLNRNGPALQSRFAFTKGRSGSIFSPVFLLRESLHSHACKSYRIRRSIPVHSHAHAIGSD